MRPNPGTYRLFTFAPALATGIALQPYLHPHLLLPPVSHLHLHLYLHCRESLS